MVQVYPNILVGNKGAAENTDLLTELGISHLLNCAGGARRGNILTGSGKVRPELGGRNIQYKELALRVELKPKPPQAWLSCFTGYAGGEHSERAGRHD